MCYLNHNGKWSEDLENGDSAFLRNVDKYLSDHMSYLRSVMYIDTAGQTPNLTVMYSLVLYRAANMLNN